MPHPFLVVDYCRILYVGHFAPYLQYAPYLLSTWYVLYMPHFGSSTVSTVYLCRNDYMICPIQTVRTVRSVCTVHDAPFLVAVQYGGRTVYAQCVLWERSYYYLLASANAEYYEITLEITPVSRRTYSLYDERYILLPQSIGVVRK